MRMVGRSGFLLIELVCALCVFTIAVACMARCLNDIVTVNQHINDHVNAVEVISGVVENQQGELNPPGCNVVCVQHRLDPMIYTTKDISLLVSRHALKGRCITWRVPCYE